MKNPLSFLLAIALVLGAGPLAWAGFSIDQPPTEVPLDPGDTFIFGGAPEVDDGDWAGYIPSLMVVPPPPGAVPYDTDAITRDDPNDPAAPMGGNPPGMFLSIDDGDIGPGMGPPDNSIELFYAPFPFGGASFPTNATEAMLGLANNPPPIGWDDDVDAFETRPILGMPMGVFFSADWDAPAGLDPGDIYWSPLTGAPFVLACDDVTQMMITTGDPVPDVDIDALHLVPPPYCAAFFPPGSPLCFLFSVDSAPPPPLGQDPGDIYITDCVNGFAPFADDVTMLGIAPDEVTLVDLDAMSVDDPSPICWDQDIDGFYDVVCGGADCDDLDQNTYPGAPEICDGKDNDCDTVVPSNETDDDPPSGDGYVECAPWVGPPGLQGNDCDDTDPNIYPGAPETQGDGIDSDCNGSDCFIATAAFGTELEGKIGALRSFRDEFLLTSPVGRALVGAYYQFSPPVADYVAERGWLRTIVRTLLLPVVGFVSLLV
jgi:hypothetical protein